MDPPEWGAAVDEGNGLDLISSLLVRQCTALHRLMEHLHLLLEAAAATGGGEGDGEGQVKVTTFGPEGPYETR